MLPERKHPRAVWVRHFSTQGKCTSPSCRISLWRCLSSPVKQNRSEYTHKWDVKCEINIKIQTYNHDWKGMHTYKHTPLYWCIHLCWCRKGWRSTVASQWWSPSAGWTERLQSPDGDRMKNWETRTSLEMKTRQFLKKKESNKPQTLWSRYLLCQMHWTGSVRRCWHLQEEEKNACHTLGRDNTETKTGKNSLPPCGKNCEYICLKVSSFTTPLGHSWKERET